MFARTYPRDAAAALAALAFVGACSSGSTALPAPAPIASTTLIARLGADTIANVRAELETSSWTSGSRR